MKWEDSRSGSLFVPSISLLVRGISLLEKIFVDGHAGIV
jgi:hypothetical protein